MRKRRLNTVFILLAIHVTFIAGAQRLPFRNYTTANGLWHNRTHVVSQDEYGYIWIGTDLGINRYDGRSFKHYPCPDGAYHSTRYCTEANGIVYFCVDGFGFARCIGDSITFIKVKNEELDGVDGLVPLSGDTIVFADINKGLYRFNGLRAERVNLPKTIKQQHAFVDIHQDLDKNIWLLSTYGLIFFPKGNLNKPIPLDCFNNKYALFVRHDADNNIYIASETGDSSTLYRYDRRQLNDIENIKPSVVIPYIHVATGMTFDLDKNLWITTAYNGIYHYSLKNNKGKYITADNGLVNNSAWCAYNDKENNLWICTENGLSKLPTQYYAAYNVSNSSSPNIKSGINWDDSTFLFSNAIGIYAWSNGNIKPVEGFSNVPGYLEERMLKMNKK